MRVSRVFGVCGGLFLFAACSGEDAVPVAPEAGAMLPPNDASTTPDRMDATSLQPIDAGMDAAAEECTPTTCDPLATCAVQNGKAVCTCASGYEHQDAGSACLDVNECAAGTATCSLSATCTNKPGGYDCACNPGYAGDGKMCTDIDECTNGSAMCGMYASCTNTPGSFRCDCAAGFKGDGKICASCPTTDAAGKCITPIEYTGSEVSFVLPPGFGPTVVVEVWGGGGGGGGNAATGAFSGTTGGAGGYASGTIDLSGGKKLNVRVGDGGTVNGPMTYGFGGASTAGGGSGGGASFVKLDTGENLFIAGGGGGGGRYAGSPVPGFGGAGGGASGVSGASGCTVYGSGAVGPVPGVGVSNNPSYPPGNSGSGEVGGAGLNGGGAGGGGYAGGGASYINCGGGGGSGYVNPALVANGLLVAGTNTVPYPGTRGTTAGTGGAARSSGAPGRVVLVW